jgi:predicted DsbA family dithiol-disulfide isomerase
VRIDIWSDVVCPWCYVGKRRFERALELFPDRDRVEIVHRSFQLNPIAPKGETSSRREGLMSKYKLSAVEVEALDARMSRTAAAEGLDYRLSDGRIGNTMDAHRLVHLGLARHLQEHVLDRFYRAYFAEDRSLFERESLIGLAAEAGLDPDEAQMVVDGDRYAADVAADIAEARAIGITGVPFFAIDGRFGVSGAQSTAVFSDALTRARATRA